MNCSFTFNFYYHLSFFFFIAVRAIITNIVHVVDVAPEIVIATTAMTTVLIITAIAVVVALIQ